MPSLGSKCGSILNPTFLRDFPSEDDKQFIINSVIGLSYSDKRKEKKEIQLCIVHWNKVTSDSTGELEEFDTSCLT